MRKTSLLRSLLKRSGSLHKCVHCGSIFGGKVRAEIVSADEIKKKWLGCPACNEFHAYTTPIIKDVKLRLAFFGCRSIAEAQKLFVGQSNAHRTEAVKLRVHKGTAYTLVEYIPSGFDVPFELKFGPFNFSALIRDNELHQQWKSLSLRQKSLAWKGLAVSAAT